MPLNRRTALILGAGASVPYNYPTGRQLRQYLTTPSGELFRVLSALGHDDAAVQEVSKCLRRSKFDTIDEFLVRYPEHAVLVKRAIAYEILSQENIDSQLAVCPDDWYSLLLIEVLEDNPSLKEGLLKILTFNYDLSLDAHVHEVLTRRHRLTDAEARDCVRNLELIHLYGHVGPVYSVHGSGRTFGRSPAELAPPAEVEAAASQLTSIADPSSAEIWSRAHEIIAGAEDVVLIGFGWGTENSKRLNLREIAKRARRIAATTVGITDLSVVQQHLPEGPKFIPTITAAHLAPTRDMVSRLFRALSEAS